MANSHPLVRNPNKEAIAEFFLSFGHVFKVFLIIVLCLIYGKRKLYGKATILLFFSMIYNTLLKQIFKVPLYPHLGQGYAFPSGHMHAFGLFYGYISIYTKNIFLKVTSAVIFVGIAISLVYMRFHHTFDVIGAVIFVIVELFLDQYCVQKYGEKTDLSIILFTSIICIFGIYYMMHEIQFHIWLSLHGMIGIILSFFVIKIGYINFLQKSLSAIISFFLNWLLSKFWNYLNFHHTFVSQLIYLFAPFIIAGSLKFSQKVNLPKTFFDDCEIFRSN